MASGKKKRTKSGSKGRGKRSGYKTPRAASGRERAPRSATAKQPAPGVDMDRTIHRSEPPNPGPNTDPSLDPAAVFGAANPDDLDRQGDKPSNRSARTERLDEIGARSPDTWDYQPDPAVEDVLLETTEQGNSEDLERKLENYTSESPILSGGDIDADWERGNDGGEETAGASVATPDQDRVDELGQALGITYNDDEPLHTEDKLEKRDRNRWELNVASREDLPEAQG